MARDEHNVGAVAICLLRFSVTHLLIIVMLIDSSMRPQPRRENKKHLSKPPTAASTDEADEYIKNDFIW